ncbi:unnamed protein product, partial [marine sediment metagenome]
PKELGEAIRESITPAYLRAGETVAYELALFDNKQARMRESLSILEASDAELERVIANIFRGYSTTEVGRRMQRMVVRVVSQLTEIFSSTEFKEKFNEVLPTAVLIACKNISWYIGRRLSRNLEYDPRRTIRLLDAIGRRKEVTAAMEQYRYRYNWQGNRDKAIRLSWQAVLSLDYDDGEGQALVNRDDLKGIANALRRAKRARISFEDGGGEKLTSKSLIIDTELTRYKWVSIEGNYPDWEKLIPTEHKLTAHFDAVEAIKAVSSLKVIA